MLLYRRLLLFQLLADGGLTQRAGRLHAADLFCLVRYLALQLAAVGPKQIGKSLKLCRDPL